MEICERYGKPPDQELWVIDVDGDHSERKLELQRGRAPELETGAAATHFDAKRIAADRMGGAVLCPAGLPFALAPYGDLRLRAPVQAAASSTTSANGRNSSQRRRGAAAGNAEVIMALLCLPSLVAPSPARPLQSSDCGVSKSTRSCGSRLARSAAFFDITPHGSESRPRDRRPLGVRIWLADVAAPLSVFPARRGEARRRASGALRLFLRPPRDARAAGSRARPRPRWNLSRHRLSRDRGQPRRHHRLSARARASDLGLSRMRAPDLAQARVRAAGGGRVR